MEICKIGSHVAWVLQARAHTLLRHKDMELSRARESAAEQFQADVTAAEAATQRTQHLLEQVGQMARVSMRLRCLSYSSVTLGMTVCSELNPKIFHYNVTRCTLTWCHTTTPSQAFMVSAITSPTAC